MALDSQSEPCWICLSSEGDPLFRPCRCPSLVHKKCLARWQLQSAGKSAVYPSWKESLTPAHLTPAVPVVSVHYNGVCYRLRVKPGPDGFASFQRQLQRITGLPVLDCMQITFQCRAPETSQELSFKGITAFDAAIHCAAISAAERIALQKSPSGGACGLSPATSSSSEDGLPSMPAAARVAEGGPEPAHAAGGGAPLATAAAAAATASTQQPAGGEGMRGGPATAAVAAGGRRTSDGAWQHWQQRRARTDSAVVLEVGQADAAQLHHAAAKSSGKLAHRLREMLRSLFV